MKIKMLSPSLPASNFKACQKTFGALVECQRCLSCSLNVPELTYRKLPSALVDLNDIPQGIGQ